MLTAQEAPIPETPANEAQSQEAPQGEDTAPSSTVIPVFQRPMDGPQSEKTTPASPPVEDTPSGQLRIQTDPPGLEVFIDGKSVGLSPMTLSLPVGEHTCKVAPPPGRAAAERTVQITTAATEILNFRY